MFIFNTQHLSLLYFSCRGSLIKILMSSCILSSFFVGLDKPIVNFLSKLYVVVMRTSVFTDAQPPPKMVICRRHFKCTVLSFPVFYLYLYTFVAVSQVMLKWYIAEQSTHLKHSEYLGDTKYFGYTVLNAVTSYIT